MSKKSGFAVFVLTILAGVVVFLGMRHVESEQQDMLKRNDPTLNAEAEETSEETPAAVVAEEVDPANMSFEEFLAYRAETDGEVQLAFYGDVSLEQGSLSQWNQEMQRQLGDRLNIQDAAYPDSDTYELYIQQTTTALTEAEPDAVLFFMPAYPDKERDMGLQETEQYFQSILNAIQTALPDTLLIAVEPHPMEGEAVVWNSRSLDYTRYLETMRAVSSGAGVPVFEVHGSFDETTAMHQLLAEDGLELNAAGEDRYLQIFNSLAEEKRDYSSLID